jgi:SAM-dependent methyltransferase
MRFYQSIAEYYHHIFPLSLAQRDFVINSFPGRKNEDVLDIGCGTGNLTFELSRKFKLMVGLDLDEAMIAKAKSQYSNSNLEYRALDMLEIGNAYGENSFDGIISFGNTLVHLDSEFTILNFFKKCKFVLREKGKFIFQIINYDRILDQKISALATIENKHITFKRKYSFNALTNLIDFNTLLTIKENGRKIENTISLLPLRKSNIEKLLKEAGFADIEYFGNFNGNIHSPESVPLIVKAV